MPEQRHLFLALLTAAELIPFGSAAAAPFCVEAQGLPPECLYHDIRACRAEAEKRRGFCTVSPGEIELYNQTGAFCLIDSAMHPICTFQSGESCAEQAASQNGVCFQNIKEDGEIAYDPSRFDRPPFR